MTLDQAQEIFVHYDGERLPVVTKDENPRLLGVVYKSSLLERYSAIKRTIDLSSDSMVDYRYIKRRTRF